MKKILYSRPDGGMSVVVPCISVDDPQGFTEEDALQRALRKDVPVGVAVAVVEDAQLPAERTFRNAWKQQGNAVTVDMPKAREIWRDKIRIARAPKFEPLDVAWFKAVEANDVVAMTDIKAKKKALRDAPADPRIEAAKTPEDLKKVWPL